MKITRRMHEAVRQYREDTGKWPNTVSIGHVELKELSDHFGYVPATINFDYRFKEASVNIRLADTPTELVCSING